jgi:tetratricopeptide (TPR) repeat protein
MLLGLVAPAPAQQHDAEARDAYAQGRAAYEGKRYEEALEKFKRSYTLSGEAALLYNIASALQSLNRPGEAAAILRDYLSARPTDPNRAELEGRIASLGKAQQMLDRESERKAKLRADEEAKARAAGLWLSQADVDRRLELQAVRDAKKRRRVLGLALGLSLGPIVVGGIIAGIVCGLGKCSSTKKVWDYGPTTVTP